MTKKSNSILIILGVIFLSLILRTPITSVGAIVGPLKSILDIKNTTLKILKRDWKVWKISVTLKASTVNIHT